MNDIEDEVLAICTYIFSCYEYSKGITKRKRKNKSAWVKDWLLERNKKGAYHAILNEYYTSSISADIYL